MILSNRATKREITYFIWLLGIKEVTQKIAGVHLGIKNLTQKFSSCNFIQFYQFYPTADSCVALDTILNFWLQHSIHWRKLNPTLYIVVSQFFIGFGEQCKQKNMEKKYVRRIVTFRVSLKITGHFIVLCWSQFGHGCNRIA